MIKIPNFKIPAQPPSQHRSDLFSERIHIRIRALFALAQLPVPPGVWLVVGKALYGDV